MAKKKYVPIAEEHKFRAAKEREQTRLVTVRLPLSYCTALDKLALADADTERASVSTIIRRAISEYFVKMGVLEK